MPIRPGRHRSLVLLVVLIVTGCGTETYKARLRETARYFAYQERLNQDLGPVWSTMGVTFRPPKQFLSIAPPAPPPTEGGEEAVELDAAEDPRQPHYLGIELPGLLGAWEATVQAESGGRDEPHQAYLYVLSNYYRYQQGKDEAGIAEDRQSFLTDVENLLSGTIGVVLPEGDSGTGVEKNQRYRDTAPRTEPNIKFTPRKDFLAVRLSPQIDVGDLALPFEMQLYEWSGQQIQLAILMVYPTSVIPSEKLQDRLLLSLETLTVTDVAPAAGQAEPGGTPAGGGGGIAF